MAERAQIITAIYHAMDELNQALPAQKRLEKDEAAPIFSSGKLDSLNMVNFILFTEEALEDTFGVLINIADQDAVSQEQSPFRTVATLADYIEQRLQQAL